MLPNFNSFSLPSLILLKHQLLSIRYIIPLLFAFLFAFSCLKASGQGGSLIEPYRFTELQEEYELNQNLFILEDLQDVYQVSQFQELSDVIHFEKYETSFKLDPKSTYWLRVQLVNGLEFQNSFNNWKLFIGKPDISTVYLMDQNGRIIQETKSGAWYPASG